MTDFSQSLTNSELQVLNEGTHITHILLFKHVYYAIIIDLSIGVKFSKDMQRWRSRTSHRLEAAPFLSKRTAMGGSGGGSGQQSDADQQSSKRSKAS